MNTVLLLRRKYILALEQLQGGFSDIGARHYFGQADFFLPKLLLKELWKYKVNEAQTLKHCFRLKYISLDAIGNMY